MTQNTEVVELTDRQKVEAQIRKVTRLCKGPAREAFRAKDFRAGVLAPHMASILDLLEVQPDDATRPVLAALLYMGPNPDPAQAADAAERDLILQIIAHRGKLDAAKIELDQRFLAASDLKEYLRQGCGEDINAVILSQPLDGDSYAVSCAKCGQPISWKAPMASAVLAEYEREAAEAAAAGGA